jgi:glutathione synthase/RimK-type ligase-like ATP-grasp enzyme
MSAPVVHVLYENPDWLPPLVAGLEAEQLPYQLQEVWQGTIDLGREPEPGIYLNRMSPSSHTRGHLESVDLMVELLAWLEHHGCRVVNGARAFALEISKVRQHLALERHGILSPRTVMAVGSEQLMRAAEGFDGPFITKHNQGGKGLGIQLFESADALRAYVDSDGFDAGPRGQVLLQQYIRPREPYITRVEILDGRFLYALRSDTSEGFELCPADACAVPAAAPDVCPADGGAKFSLSPLNADDPLVAQYLALCAAEGIEVAGIEFVEDDQGHRYTYDINGTTNYNAAVGEQAGLDGMRELARYVARLAAP